jgi:hypothetical protein
MLLVTLVTATLPDPFVKFAGLPVQSGLNCPGAFVTLTATVHVELPAANWRLLTVIRLLPAVAVVAAAALTHVPPTPAGVPTTRPAGSVSTKPTFDSAGDPAGLDRVKIRVVSPPALITVGEKLFVNVGGTPPANAGAAAPVATATTRERAGRLKRFLFIRAV